MNFRLTVDGGTSICRGRTFDAVVSTIARMEHKTYHLRDTAKPHVVMTLDLATPSLTVTNHGQQLDPEAAYQACPWANGVLRVLSHIQPNLKELIYP